MTVTPTSGDTDTATVSGALTFTTATWATAQTVTVSGALVFTGAAAGATSITHSVAGADYGTNNVTADSGVDGDRGGTRRGRFDGRAGGGPRRRRQDVRGFFGDPPDRRR